MDPFLREWISYGGKRTSANPAGVAVHPFGFRLADLVGVPARGKSVYLVDYSAGVFSFQNGSARGRPSGEPLGVRYSRIYR